MATSGFSRVLNSVMTLIPGRKDGGGTVGGGSRAAVDEALQMQTYWQAFLREKRAQVSGTQATSEPQVTDATGLADLDMLVEDAFGSGATD